MKFTNIRDLKYITEDKSSIDLYAICEEYGEIPMTLNLVDTEDLHTFIDEEGNEYPLEEYCRTLKIIPYAELRLSQEQLQAQVNAEAKEYLASTDWYVTRFAETGKEIPVEVKIKRDEARLQIQ